jgi:hypothetical protein
MNILPLLLDIGFTKNHEDSINYYLARSLENTYLPPTFTIMEEELFEYCIDTNGVYNLILQRTNFVSIRVEVKEENEKLVYDFISNHFGKEWVRDFKLKKIL